MKTASLVVALVLATAIPALSGTAAQARDSFDTAEPGGGSDRSSAPLQCVPYARDVTGIRIYGDAHTWWDQAQGRYARGRVPRVGAVMAIRPYGNSRLGHVAAVSRIVDSRTILLRHANWSSPGQIENDVRAVDVSQGNDWSEVRIWYGPNQALGNRHWPLYGFIYRNSSGAGGSATGKAGRQAPSADLIGEIIARNAG